MGCSKTTIDKCGSGTQTANVVSFGLQTDEMQKKRELRTEDIEFGKASPDIFRNGERKGDNMVPSTGEANPLQVNEKRINTALREKKVDPRTQTPDRQRTWDRKSKT